MKILPYLAVLASLLIWPLALYGFDLLMSEPEPGMSTQDIYLHKQLIPGMMLSAAAALFFVAAWLSGFCARQARWQSVIAALSNLAFLGLTVMLFNTHG